MKALRLEDIENWFKPILKQNPFIENFFEGIFGKKNLQKEIAQALADINKETKGILRLMCAEKYKSQANALNNKLHPKESFKEISLS